MPTKKDKIMKAATIVTLFVIFSGMILSKQTHRTEYSPESLQQQTEDEENIQDAQEREEGKRLLESFLITYNSYRLGDMSNIESLYSSMDEEMAKKEKEKVARLKKEYAAYKEFITVESNLKNSKIINYEKERLTLQISIEKTIIEGAFVPDPLGNENDGFVLIGKNGVIYEGSIKDLMKSPAEEIFTITGSRESGNWKISEIQKVS